MNFSKLIPAILIFCVVSVTSSADPLERVHAVGHRESGAILSRLGIFPGAEASATSAGHAVSWSIRRDETDDLRMRHVFYTQSVRTAAGEAKVVGSDVGVHYAPDGTIRSVSGAHAGKLLMRNRVAIPRAAVRERIEAGARKATPRGMAPGRFAVREEISLAVQTQEDGAAFVWHVAVEDGQSRPFVVVMDAESGEVTSAIPEFANDNCGPSQFDMRSATAVPLNSAVANRTLAANYTGGRPIVGSVHAFEAAMPSEWYKPAMLVYQTTSHPDFICGPNALYTLLPVRAVNGAAVYDDFGDEWLGRAGGDALHHTSVTMNVFRQFGRNGWDGAGGEARITVNAPFYPDNASFSLQSTTSYPAGVIVGPRQQNAIGLEAALDLVAHEWGHGIVFTSPGMLYVGTQAELHEGFSDVVGHLVEKAAQPYGYGPEQSSDWAHAEDGGIPYSWIRLADSDDGVGGMSYHREDDDYSAATPHAKGHKLAVAFRMLADGGSNPWCAGHPSASGCDASTPGIGQDMASAILFRVLTRYATSSSTWEELASWAKLAAFDLYSNCWGYSNRNAEWEQQQVEQAFRAIGYPSGTAPYEFCWLNPY